MDSLEVYGINDLTVPEYLPLDSSLVRDFGKSSKFSNSLKNLDNLIDGIVKETDKYVDFVLDLPVFDLNEAYLERNKENLRNLLQLSVKLNEQKTLVDNAKKKYQSHRDPVISMETLSHYQSKKNVTTLSGLLMKENASGTHDDSFDEFMKTNDKYAYVNNVAFVLKTPLDPLPDDQEDEELKVSGGKISLKDPLSMNYLERPITSRKCLHTYDESTITNYINEGNRICPINGCDSHVSLNDLKFDKIMHLRVRTFLAHEKSKKNPGNVERL